MMRDIEIGPIRPPSESSSLLYELQEGVIGINVIFVVCISL